ncbi:hypothetical protein BDW68DRAFT_25335 [Aspergillus falconensis]
MPSLSHRHERNDNCDYDFKPWDSSTTRAPLSLPLTMIRICTYSGTNWAWRSRGNPYNEDNLSASLHLSRPGLH